MTERLQLSVRRETPSTESKMTIELLDAFADAWNRHDVDAILSMMTPDCAFETSRGTGVKGTVHTGQDEVRRGIEEVFASFRDAQWRKPTHFVAGDRGVSEWVFTGTGPDGLPVEVQGCDLFTFRDGKIAVKNSYRKNRVA
jgi:ketosteroid isomerase-like protein